MSYPWLRGDGRLRHLVTLEHMPRAVLESLLVQAQAMHDADPRILRQRLVGRTLCNLFFEPSTRTRCSFQLAAQRLGMDVLNFDLASSSAGKGETDADTLATLRAMRIDAFAVRHSDDAAATQLASQLDAADSVLINAGVGRTAHPSQGLLDMLTLRQAKGDDFSRLRVVICGDIRHSRVARSDIHALSVLGAGEIRLCGPRNLLPDSDEFAHCPRFDRFDDALAGADAVIMLRLQRERMAQGLVASREDYFRDWGLDPRRLALAAADAIVLHPGPMNRGIEIDSQVADGPQSRVLQQVRNGVAMRMAILWHLLADD